MVFFEKNRRRAAVAPDVDDDRRIAPDPSGCQRIILPAEHGEDHFRLLRGMREREFTVTEWELDRFESHP